MDIVAGSATATKAFDFFQQEFAKIGVTSPLVHSVQSTLINNVIYGEYDCASWNQFGGVDQSLNYVWFDSQSGDDRRRPRAAWAWPDSRPAPRSPVR